MKKIVISVLVLFSIIVMPFQAFTAHALTSSERVQNGGFEQAGAPASTANLWSNFQNGFTRSNEAAHTGSWSAKAQNTNTSSMSGAAQRIDLHQTSVQPVFIGGYVKGNNITMAPVQFSAQVCMLNCT
jgi:hypothetical protein